MHAYRLIRLDVVCILSCSKLTIHCMFSAHATFRATFALNLQQLCTLYFTLCTHLKSEQVLVVHAHLHVKFH